MVNRWGFTVIVFVLGFASSCSAAVLRSPFPSTTPGLSIPNSHSLPTAKDGGKIYRGSAPYYDREFKELSALGITDILIFKNQSQDEVDTEIVKLQNEGFTSSQIKNIPFLWKEFESFEEPCRQTIEALEFFQEIAKDSHRKLFFHCTVGEDRTGYLAGLYELLSQKKNVNDVFRSQMCQNGFADGNPKKPDFVVDAIHEQLTIYYFAMAYLFEKTDQNLNHLNPSVCQNDVLKESGFYHYLGSQVEKTHCEASQNILTR